MAYVGNQPARGQFRKLTDISSSFNGVTTTFTTSVPPGTSEFYVTAGSASQLLVSLGGVIQQPDVDYTVSTNSITFTTAPAAGLAFFGVLMGDALNSASPSDGTITTAKLAGNLSVGLAGGSAAAPSLFFTGDSNNGIYSPGADTVAISTNGAQRLTVNSSGNVGIGTTPTSIFHVKAATNRNFKIDSAGGGGGDLRISALNDADSANVNLQLQGDQLFFVTGGSEKARLDSSGRLLVGTSTARAVGSPVTWKMQIEGLGTDTGYPGLGLTNNANDNECAYIVLAKTRGTSIGSSTIVQNNDNLGVIAFAGADGTDIETRGAEIRCAVDGTPGANDLPARLVFSTTADGASSPTERMRIGNAGRIDLSYALNSQETALVSKSTNTNKVSFAINAVNDENFNTAQPCAAVFGRISGNGRSVNAGGTFNASGADYAEYMIKAGDFTIAKGAICGITANGLLTLDYTDAVSFVVKSTNPSYVGGDTWGGEDVVGSKPDSQDADALAQWEADLETARQKVDRIAFAGQAPVNVMGATPGQYIVPVESADGGIEGVAKHEADLTLAEYMRAVGKVIAIEDDGRARIIVKVA